MLKTYGTRTNVLGRPVLLDTSVWIAYLRKEKAVFDEVNMLIDSGRVRLLGLVLAELYQGCKSQKEIDVTHDLTQIFPRLNESAQMWEAAGLLAYKLRKQGESIGLADCYIATVALKSKVLIYSYDKHFKVLAPICGLQLYSP